MLTGTVDLNGDLLRADREALMLSREAVAAATNQMDSIETIRRAEAGHRVQVIKLRQIARALNTDVERYTAGQSSSSLAIDTLVPDIDLTGIWLAFWNECDLGRPPVTVRERVQLEQTGVTVSGFGVANVNGKKRRETIDFGRVERNLFYGMSSVDGWTRPTGNSSFQVIVSRNDDWMDGYVTWNDADYGSIEVSRFVWVREDGQNADDHLADAMRMMDHAMVAHRWRRAHWL